MNLFALVNGAPWIFGPVTFAGTITFTGSALLADGSAAAPALAFAADTDTGIFRPGTHEIAFATGGTERASFISQGLKLSNVGGSFTVPNVFANGDQDTGLAVIGGNRLALIVGGATGLCFNASGNLLVGTTIDGGQKLQVSGTANISSTLTVNGAAANYALNVVGFVEAQGTTSSKGFRIYNTANGEAVNFQSHGITQTYDGTFDISSSNTTGLRIYGNAGSPLWRWVPWNGGSAGIVTNDSSGYINTSKSLPLLPITAPAAPASGWILYTDSADSNKLKAKASTGTVVTLGTP